MSSCNDPKCPLNRQGVPHENHESIKNKPVQNPCNDPRCAMNRMGMKHEVHDGKKINAEKPREEKTRKEKISKQTFDDEFRGSATDALNELGKQIHGRGLTNSSKNLPLFPKLMPKSRNTLVSLSCRSILLPTISFTPP